MKCKECQAMMWDDERIDKYRDVANPKFNICCGNGKVPITIITSNTSTIATSLI